MKKRMMKRILALMLSLFTVAPALPGASAALADDITTRPLKVLCIGHSFAVDVMNHLWSVCHAEGLDLVTGLAYYSGCTLAQHVNFANNNSTVYRYYKNNNSATQTITYNVTLQHCIEDENWDIIVLQTGTSSAGKPKTYQPYLDQLIAYTDAHKTNPNAQYVWHMTWSYQAGFPTATFTAADQMQLYEDIAGAAVEVIVPDSRIKAIIPSATAFQNARSSYFGDNLNRDGQHANDLGKLIADYAWYCTLTGKTLTELKYPMAGDKTLSAGDQKVVMESVNNAMQTPFALTPSAYAPGSTTHYTWKTVNTTGTDNLAALPTNVFYDNDAVRTKAFLLSNGTFYEASGPRTLVSYAMYNALGTYKDSASGNTYHYGLPYRTITTQDNTFYAIDENLWFDLAQMPELDTSGVGVVNLSMNYIYPTSAATNAAFTRGMQVYVSLDGENFLPGYAGVRSATLLGGGRINSTEALLYRIETENLLDIPGVERGDVIRRIRIMPDGTYCRTFGSYRTNSISVNTYSSPEAFDLSVPSDAPETVSLGESTMRAIPVAEGERTASIAWTTPQTITCVSPNGSSDYATSTNTRTYEPGKNYRGPVYERDIDSTRELFASSIVDGVYGHNGAGFAPDDNGKNTAYGMDCQTFVFNAISRVSRSNAWSVMNTFGETYTRLVGELNTAPRPFYSDVDIVDRNTEQQMYEHYALAKAGDVAVHYLTNKNNSVHTRLVKRVSVVRKSGGAIDGSASKMYFTEQAGGITQTDGYYSSSRVESSSTFDSLRSGGYVVFTLTDYAAGKVEKASVQAVCAPLVKDGSYADGVHLAFSSNYRIIKYTVTLRDVTNSADLFSRTEWCMEPDVLGVNFEDEALNALLADLPDGEYSIDVAVDSGPLTSTTQEKVPTTVKSFGFIRGKAEPCMGNHTGRKALTQAYFDNKSPVTPAADGKYYTLTTGSYYLAEDIVLPYSIRINGAEDVTICLNGHTLRCSRGATGSTDKYYCNTFFEIVGTLTICDHTGAGKLQVNTNGEITGITYAPYIFHVSGICNLYSGSLCGSRTRYGAVLVNGGDMPGVFNMYGGSITGNQNVSGGGAGGGVELQGNGVFNMYDGEISGNGNTSVVGAGVDLNGNVGSNAAPVFNMTGGTISGNTGKTGAGVRVTKGGTFNLSGGTIANNTTTEYGAGVLVQSGGLFHMTGGTISGNESKKPGAGVYVSGAAGAPGTFEMIDGAITGNRATASSDSDARGGGVGMGSYGNFDCSGGAITGNSAKIGGGIFLTGAGAAMEVTYYVNVSGNTATVTGSGVCATTYAGVTMAGGTIAGNTGGDGGEVLIAGAGASLAQTGGTIGAKGSANRLIFRGTSTATGITGEFTGGTLYLPIVTDGDAGYDIAVRGGSIAGIGSPHKGVSVTGGQFASSDNVLACAPAGAALTDSGDAYFKYMLAEPQDTPGDFTGDGKVNAKDIVLLQRFIAGGYGVTVDESKADLTGDGKVNAKDIVLLQRFVAGGYGVTL